MYLRNYTYLPIDMSFVFANVALFFDLESCILFVFMWKYLEVPIFQKDSSPGGNEARFR